MLLHASFFTREEIMNIAIVEDEQKAAERLSSMIRRYGKEHDMSFELFTFKDGLDFLNGYRAVYDVVFMDIEMPHCNGMNICRKLRQIDQTVSIVFVTNLSQYALDGYAVSAVGYIVKPLSYETFSFNFDRVIKHVMGSQKRMISIISDKETIRLNTDEIFYLEVMNHAVIYHTAQGDYETWDSLSNAEKLFEPGTFARCNNCFLVNLKHVRGIKGDTVLVANTSLKISRLKKKDFMDALANFT